MARQSTSLGVDWFLPGQRRRFATTTVASSNLIVLLGGEGATFGDLLTLIRWDEDALAVAQHFCAHGYRDTPVSQLVS